MTALFFEEAMLPEGWARDVRVELADERIASVLPGAAARAGDERHAAGLPGLPNLHSHAFQRGMAGLGERRGAGEDSFWTWREAMYRFLGAMGPEEVEAVAAQAYVEMLERGFTRVGEFHYLHHDRDGRPYADRAELSSRIAAAADATGIGLTLLPVFYNRGGFGGAPPGEGQRRFLHDLDGFAALLDSARRALAPLQGAVLGLAPHSLRAATPEQLRALPALLPAGAPIHLHLAEQRREVEECLAWSGRRPAAWLLDHAPLDRHWCLIHATHLDDDEVARLARSGAVAGLCPITEASLGDGTFRGRDWLRLGGGYGVGSDSNVLIDAAGELRQLEYSQRLLHRARNLLAAGPGHSTGGSMLRAALDGGARALGAEPAAIRPGAPADLVALDAEAPALFGRHGDDLVDAWVFAGGAVSAAWVRGRQLVRSGRHRHRDAVAARFRAAIRRLRDAA